MSEAVLVTNGLKRSFTQGDVTVIAKGVEPGEVVVTDGQSQLRPGAKIAAKNQAAPP